MGFLSNLFGWGKEKGPAQLLVLGAELKCPYGSKHSFFLPPLREMAINEMPCGCVKDSKAWENIFPFGDCKEGFSCAEFMDLEEKWENLTPQELQIEGEEAITTDSILICKKCGVGIEAVTSGQDGIIAGKWIEEARQLYEIEQKYPGLVETIMDAGGSVYLNGDMYKDAINFLEDCIKKNNGEIHIGTLIVPDNLESNMIRILMDLLLPGCDASRPEGYLTVLEERGVATGMYDTPGWDPHLLNAQMIQMLRVDCEQTAEKIRTDPVARFPEEHKKGMRAFSELVMGAGYTFVIFFATAPEDVFEKAGEMKERWSAKLKALKNGIKGKSGTSTIKSSDLVFGSSTKSAQKLMNQMNSRGWTEDLIRSTVDNPYTIRTSINKATGNSATVFYTKQGSYVIVDDVTKVIVQISDNINPSTWVPDSSIVDPYIPD